MGLYQDALAIKDTIIENRRYLHQIPELGLHLPETAAFVEKKLREMGYEPQRIGESGIVVTAGKKDGKCFLIRGDMDALPVEEMADIDFRSVNGKMHACGHDCHTANMLGAAQLLKAHEDELEGQVKLMFQPAEETMDGAKMMIEGGVMEAPHVDAALGIHVFTNMSVKPGTLILIGEDTKFAAVDWFTVRIKGKGCHGAQPHNGVDPLNVMTHIYLALQAINAREMNPMEPLVLTIGQMHGGNTGNVIPEEAMMSGTIRTLSAAARVQVKERVKVIVSTVAAAFGASASVEYGSGCPVLNQDKALYHEVKDICKDLDGVTVVDGDDIGINVGGMVSEDFAYIAEMVPSVYLSVAAGTPEDGYCYPQHHPKAMFHDDALCVGAAAYAYIAMEWLKRNK